MSTSRSSMAPMAGLLLAASLGLSLAATPARADTLVYDFGQRFGAVPSDGTAPWLRAEFTDVAPGQVTLSLSAPGLSADTDGGESPEYADEWWFNLNPLYNADNLVNTYVSGEVATFILPSGAGGGALKPDGDGTFDFRVDFTHGHLAQGMTSVYTLSGIAGLTAADFRFYSEPPSGGAGPFLAAAHIQSTGAGNQGSDFVAPIDTPEPAGLAVLGVALAGFSRLRRRRGRNVQEWRCCCSSFL